MEANTALQEVIVAPSLSKATQMQLADSLVAQVVNGDVNPMQAFIQIKAISEVCKKFLEHDEIVTRTKGAIARCGKDVPAFNGAKVTLTHTTRYDYASSNDSQYLALVRQKEAIEEKIKAREMFLKAIDDSLDYVDPETGEVKTIFAPATTQSKNLRVTFAKQ